MRSISQSQGNIALPGGGALLSIGIAILAGISAVGCSANTAAPSSAGHQSSSPSVPSSPSGPLPSRPQTSPTAAGGPKKLTVSDNAAPRPMAAGTYVTTAPNGFFPGLTLTLPDGWSAAETDSGEVSLHPADHPDDVLLLWKDVVAVATNNRDGKVGSVLENVDTSADAIVKWLTTTSDFAVLAKPKSATVGDGIKGVQLTLTTSKTANFADGDCPDNPHCSALFRDPAHWPTDFYAIGGAEVSRIFVATLPYPGDEHTFWVVLDAVNADDLSAFATEAKPIIDSLRLPATFVVN